MIDFYCDPDDELPIICGPPKELLYRHYLGKIVKIHKMVPYNSVEISLTHSLDRSETIYRYGSDDIDLLMGVHSDHKYVLGDIVVVELRFRPSEWGRRVVARVSELSKDYISRFIKIKYLDFNY